MIIFKSERTNYVCNCMFRCSTYRRSIKPSNMELQLNANSKTKMKQIQIVGQIEGAEEKKKKTESYAFRTYTLNTIRTDIIFIRLSFYLCISFAIVSLQVLTSSSVISSAFQNFMLFMPFSEQYFVFVFSSRSRLHFRVFFSFRSFSFAV